MEITKPKLWTESGLKELGRLLRRSRAERGWSLRDLELYLEQKTGHRITNSTLSGLERANREPNWNTLAIVAAAEFVVKEDGTPYTVEEFSAIASECFFSAAIPVKSVRCTQEVLPVTKKEEDFLPSLTVKGGRRLKNLVLAECSRRGWGAEELIAAGCDAELYQVIMREDWFQRYPSERLIKPLAALLSIVRYWNGDNPVLTQGSYNNRVEQLWMELERNGIATHC